MKVLLEERNYDSEFSVDGLIDDLLHECEFFPYFVVDKFYKERKCADVRLVGYSYATIDELQDRLNKEHDIYKVELLSTTKNSVVFRIWFKK